jgi:hypothetical protein
VFKDFSPKEKLQQVFVPKENVMLEALSNFQTKIVEVKPHFPKWE